MKKIEFIKVVKRRVTGNEEKIHDRYFEKNISMAFNQIFYNTFIRNRSDLDLYTKQYPLTVEKDDVGNYYCDIPVDIVQLPIPGNGVRQIRGTSQNKYLEFVPISSQSRPIFNGLDVGKVDDKVGYSVDGSKIWFHENMMADIDTVVAMILRSFESYDKNENIYVPSGKDEELIMLVTQFMMGTPGKKVINDNNPNTP